MSCLYILLKNVEVGVGILFDFSLYTVFLQVILVTYFKRALKRTRRKKSLKSGKMYHHQH